MSPVVAFTILLFPVISRIETSNVPPPKSKIKTFLGPEFSSLYASPIATLAVKSSAAAVGSLMIPLQSSPAILAAFLVDYF